MSILRLISSGMSDDIPSLNCCRYIRLGRPVRKPSSELDTKGCHFFFINTGFAYNYLGFHISSIVAPKSKQITYVPWQAGAGVCFEVHGWQRGESGGPDALGG